MKSKKSLYLKAKEIYAGENSGHDFSHIERVLKYAKHISKHYKVDKDVLYVSCLFHDVHRVMSKDDGGFVPAEESIEEVKRLLKEFNFSSEFLDKVLFNIKYHEKKSMDVSKMPIELQILQDADILDALGEVGLKRTLRYCKNKAIPVTNVKFPLDCKEYIADVNPISTSHYIYRTMISQVKFLHTKEAKKMSKGKIKILEKFIDTNIKKNNMFNYDII